MNRTLHAQRPQVHCAVRLVGALAMFGILWSCGGSESTTPLDHPIASVKLMPNRATLGIDSRTPFDAYVPSGSGDTLSVASIRWSSSDDDVARVSAAAFAAAVIAVEKR